MRLAWFCAGIAVLALTAPLSARDSLGVFSDWGAFRDPATPRCYAIAMPQANKAGDYQPFASIGTWPRRALRNQLHVRLSRRLSPAGTISLRVGNQSFELTGGGGDAWAKDRKADAAIVAAMRSAGAMIVTARDRDGRIFNDSYRLAGAATAMDAAAVGCAKLK
ncbi:MAG: hypothetical protein P0Y56_03425 [Candidatus Andeanibacterium colombiense]|uniref:Mlr4354 like protein n=1 Tax=Candidatus Andeanibacterium colombiense TaxID=3121345 RepID=A0AAJ6BQ45_9SPHN|nr:MAG: hypothetical protein P0Y56_03425 [Sphingomonadaceae bacterium]